MHIAIIITAFGKGMQNRSWIRFSRPESELFFFSSGRSPGRPRGPCTYRPRGTANVMSAARRSTRRAPTTAMRCESLHPAATAARSASPSATTSNRTSAVRAGADLSRTFVLGHKTFRILVSTQCVFFIVFSVYLIYVHESRNVHRTFGRRFLG